MLRAFEVAASGDADRRRIREIKKQVHAALIAQMPAAPPAGTWVECTNQHGARQRSARSSCSAHHLAKVLAYTGEPDVIDAILAIMPKGDEDQPGQIDYVYSLRVIDSRLDDGAEETGDRVVREGVEMARRLDVRRTREQHLRRDHRRVHGRREAGGLQGGAAVRADHRRRRRGGATAGRGAAGGGTPARAAAAGAAVPGGRGGPGGRGRGPQVPLDRQERYDNLVFPRGGPAGSLAGRGGGAGCGRRRAGVP